VSVDTTQLSNGSHTFTAIASDAAGQSATASVTVTVFTDATAPTVSFVTPANGSSVGGTIAITASASDNVGVTSVQFRLDGAAIGTALTSAPYTVNVDTTQLSNGSHTFTAIASDASGQSATASVTVTVFNDATAPTVSFVTPANGSTVGGTIAITASASDNVGVTSVQFRLDGAAIGAALTSAPYTVSVDTTQLSNGSHTFTAIASDASGQSATASVTITVFNDATAPTVSFVTPANGATVTGTVAVTASAQDNAGVSSVQFFV